MEWVSVNDRLPNVNENVLMFCPLDERNPWRMGSCFEGYYAGDGEWVQVYDCCSIEVTHWMPLPEPPRLT